MKATVNVLCYKSKTLSNGEHPLMICLCKDNKRKYISIGASVNPRFWDFDKNKPKRNCPNKEQLSKHIAETEQKYCLCAHFAPIYKNIMYNVMTFPQSVKIINT